ncbi:glycosyltransferase family 2 protein [Prevotella sp. S7 MS 2]|uniref:glycosyltransferase family 2 protein n=1 Tax=Prevotella sp. S7 MS 2 TaxID=1287488 RepID=UPI0005142964|nr:glycosyltransferase family 2 protein [Prevotella sp. S7 MS 2]KGI60834.1 glycosyl transferase [Prevotella sp. S7 MS 2]
MTEIKKIIAVVVTYNRIELLQRGIASLRQQQGLSKVIVVDNGCTDGTCEWLDEQTDLTVIHQENVGGSGGFYTGIQRAYTDGADWIWCMDDDVFPRPDCLIQLLKYIEQPSIGILSPRRLLDGQVFTHEFQKFDFTNPLASMHGRKLAKQQISQATEIVGADFEGPLINRTVVERIGLPNKELFIFCDDTDYCLRTHLSGFRLQYIPDALMDKHKFFNDDTWVTRNQKKKWKRYYQIRNEAYLNHHYGRNWGVRYLRSFIGMIGYIIPALFTMPFSKAWQWKDLPMLWQAYSDGIHERLGKR